MGTLTETSATANDKLTGFGVDTATCYVGTTAGYAQGALSTRPTDEEAASIEGLTCMTGWGDGYYPVYKGAHLLDADAVAFVEFCPATIKVTHTDIDGEIHWMDDVFTAEQTYVARETTIECPDGVLIVAGDPWHSCQDVTTVKVEPGTYTVRVHAEKDGDFGGHNVCVTITPAK